MRIRKGGEADGEKEGEGKEGKQKEGVPEPSEAARNCWDSCQRPVSQDPSSLPRGYGTRDPTNSPPDWYLRRSPAPRKEARVIG